jgi:ribosomal protein L37AE/L43A
MAQRVEKSMESVQHEDFKRKCPECQSTDIDRNGEEYFCAKCGMVLE